MKPKTGSTGTLLSEPAAKAGSEKEAAFHGTSDPDNDKILGRALVIAYIILLIILSISQIASSFAQTPQRGLQVGDTIPEKLWHLPLQVAGHCENRSTITLNDYRGKLIILDFWATWCGSCIAAMPATHQLADEFKQQVQIIPVTYEGVEKVTAFLKSNRIMSELKICSVVGDSALRFAFPHRILPHYVWISQDGKLELTTSSDQVNRKNILSVLKKNPESIRPKVDLDVKGPVFLRDELLAGQNLLHYSVFFKGRYDGLGSIQKDQKSASGIVIGKTMANMPLGRMYIQVAKQLFSSLNDVFADNRLIVNVKYPEQLMRNYSKPSSAFPDSDYYTYSVRVPESETNRLYSYILDDLNRYSSYFGKVEKKREKCLVLRLKDSTLLMPKSRQRENTLFSDDRAAGCLKNYPVSALTALLNYHKRIRLPVLDETGYRGNVDLCLPSDFSLRGLRTELGRFGLELDEEEREINVFKVYQK